MDALATFSRAVNEATSLLGESGFAEALGNGMRELIEADDVSLIRYPDAGPPVIEYTLPPKRRGKTTLDRYVKGPFLLDPFYRAAQVDECFGGDGEQSFLRQLDSMRFPTAKPKASGLIKVTHVAHAMPKPTAIFNFVQLSFFFMRYVMRGYHRTTND